MSFWICCFAAQRTVRHTHLNIVTLFSTQVSNGSMCLSPSRFYNSLRFCFLIISQHLFRPTFSVSSWPGNLKCFGNMASAHSRYTMQELFDYLEKRFDIPTRERIGISKDMMKIATTIYIFFHTESLLFPCWYRFKGFGKTLQAS